MPPENKAPGSPDSWLKHALSDLELAKIDRPSRDPQFKSADRPDAR